MGPAPKKSVMLIEVYMAVVSRNSEMSRNLVNILKSYYNMMKPTVGLLVVVTTVPTMFMASRSIPSVITILATLVGTFFATSSAGVFNHLVDSDIDGDMERTQKRPLPSGSVNKSVAISLAVLLGCLSFLLLYRYTTPLAAYTALAANFFYVVIYTIILKRNTVQNIVIGGAAGAVGPLIGWSAITNSFSWQAWILFAIIFLWTPPHFWALAIKYKEDYSRANIPMMPSVKGVAYTKVHIFAYSLTLVPSVLTLCFDSYANWIYGLGSFLLSMGMVILSYQLLKSDDETKAMPLFIFSCFYLFGIFGLLTIDSLIQL